jgi:hypothetical protein
MAPVLDPTDSATEKEKARKENSGQVTPRKRNGSKSPLLISKRAKTISKPWFVKRSRDKFPTKPDYGRNGIRHILAFDQNNPDGSVHIMTLTIEGNEKSGWKPGEPKPFLNSPFNEEYPAFSPDGRWLAYASNESGNTEVYVRSFPSPGGKWQVSTGGGGFPKWSRSSKELFYRTAVPDLGTFRPSGSPEWRSARSW